MWLHARVAFAPSLLGSALLKPNAADMKTLLSSLPKQTFHRYPEQDGYKELTTLFRENSLKSISTKKVLEHNVQ